MTLSLKILTKIAHLEPHMYRWLYDFKNDKMENRLFSIKKTCNVIKLKNGTLFINSDQTQIKNNNYLFSISLNSNDIKIDLKKNPFCEFEKNNFFYVITNNTYPGGFLLKENSIIKLGRIFLKVLAIQTKKTHPILIEKCSKIKINPNHDVVLNESLSDETCRICFLGENNIDNPLICPCKCAGSLKYTHLECLKTWINRKLEVNANQKVSSTYLKNLTCEICKKKYPLIINHNNKKTVLVNLTHCSMDSFAIIQSFTQNYTLNGIHIINLTADNKISVGRGQECDLKITDITISRLHAIFVLEKEKMHIQDCNSKFGTLIQINEPIFLDEFTTKSPIIQYGETLLEFKMMKPWFSCLPSKIFNKNSCACF